MSVKNSYTTADYLEWDTAMALIRKLYKDGDYRFSLLIGCGCFFGLRISDLRKLNWAMLLDDDSFMLNEQKTGKRRIVKINKGFQRHIQDCYDALKITNRQQPCFVSQKGGVYSIQRINSRFKEIKVKYRLQIKNFSTHTMRKTFGRRVVESAPPGEVEMQFLRLQTIFQHSSPMITRAYLGFRQKEINDVYESLDF